MGYRAGKKRKKRKAADITGTLMKTKRSFGFVVSENGAFDDIFISPRYMNGAMHGDAVEIRVFPENNTRLSSEGEVVKVLARANREIIGTYERGHVIPDDRRIDEEIIVRRKDKRDAKDGDKVAARIVKYPDGEPVAEAKVVEIICAADEPGGDIKAMMRQYNIAGFFPSKVSSEAERIVKKPFDMDEREDLRGRVVFTIDGADAKDLDDAVSIEKNEKGNFILGVHIADVSFYVEEESALDREALKRGTSVYLIDQVAPMLPEALSNGICSLDKGKDRLALSLDMEITPDGEIISHRLYESLICSCEKMAYSDVSDIIENKDLKLSEKYDNIYKDLLLMDELAVVLYKKRDGRGSLDFELGEAEIRLDEFGVAESVSLAERRVANKIIEEFMLAANEVIAERFCNIGAPFVYRVHEKPTPEKIEEFKEFIESFGLRLKAAKSIHPRMLNALLKQIEGKPYENVVNSFMLRSMQKAYYSPDCDGHFGLALKYYCHFTAPIRRYPDLLIHRIIKESLSGRLDYKRSKVFKKKTAAAAESSSIAERKALELEREVEKMKKAEYMSFHIGEEFEGLVSGVKPYGVFVELPNTIEGLAHGRNDSLSPGDKVKVFVEGADPAERRVDFIICK